MDVITLEQLVDWRPCRPSYGVVGHPIRHSRSPAMHRAAYFELGLDADYLAFEVAPADLADALDLMRSAGLLGLNLTVPHKEIAARLVPNLSDEAARIGAVNTIVFEQETLHGHNTDARGFARAIEEEFGANLSGLGVFIVGTGGAGRAIAWQCAWAGCPRLVLANRTEAKAAELGDEIRSAAPGISMRILALDDPGLGEELAAADLIVNATSLGLRPEDASPLGDQPIRPGQWVYDTIYNPPETRLIQLAKGAGAKTANGLSMLLHQGALSFELWLGRGAPIEAMRRALG